MKEVEVNNNFKQCCAKFIREIWVKHGGSLSIVYGQVTCPECGQYIGLTPTSEDEANEFLNKFGLKPIVNPKPKPDLEGFEYAKKQLIYSLRVYIDRFEQNVLHYKELEQESDFIIEANTLLKKVTETL